jgi:hypothetical protein
LIDFGAKSPSQAFAHQTKAKTMPEFDARHAPIQGASLKGHAVSA